MRLASIALFAVAALAGCSNAPTRSVSGQLRVDMSAMNHPVVIAQSSDHRTFVADVTSSGRFTLQLPAGASYRMSLASTTRSGIYTTTARINWPLQSGAARWATLGGGGAINLGAVFERGSSPSGTATSESEHGDDDDHGDCHEDDHSCSSHGGEVDDDCDHKVSSGDHCDQDDDADEHDHDADEDECKGDGGTTSGGGGATGGGGGTGTTGGGGVG